MFRTEKLLQLIEEAKRYTHEDKEYSYRNMQRLQGPFTEMTKVDAMALYQQKQKELEKQYADITKALKWINKNEPVKIQHPELIIAGRVTTGYGGKLDAISVNDLLTISLSDIKQEGIILTPFQFNIDGTSQRIKESRSYKIKRAGDTVYWIIEFCNLSNYDYNRII